MPTRSDILCTRLAPNDIETKSESMATIILHLYSYTGNIAANLELKCLMVEKITSVKPFKFS